MKELELYNKALLLLDEMMESEEVKVQLEAVKMVLKLPIKQAEPVVTSEVNVLTTEQLNQIKAILDNK
jgi:hypothetical protein